MGDRPRPKKLRVDVRAAVNVLQSITSSGSHDGLKGILSGFDDGGVELDTVAPSMSILIDMPLADTFGWVLLDPCQLLTVFVAASPRLQSMSARALREHPCTFDEYSPGDETTSMVLSYYSDLVRYTLVVLRSNEIHLIAGGWSARQRNHVIRRCCSASGISTAGIPLTIQGENKLFFALVALDWKGCGRLELKPAVGLDLICSACCGCGGLGIAPMSYDYDPGPAPSDGMEYVLIESGTAWRCAKCEKKVDEGHLTGKDHKKNLAWYVNGPGHPRFDAPQQAAGWAAAAAAAATEPGQHPPQQHGQWQQPQQALQDVPRPPQQQPAGQPQTLRTLQQPGGQPVGQPQLRQQPQQQQGGQPAGLPKASPPPPPYPPPGWERGIEDRLDRVEALVMEMRDTLERLENMALHQKDMLHQSGYS